MHPTQWRDEAWRALEAYRELDDRIGLYKALCSLGSAPREVIDEAQAGALLEEAAQLEDPAWSPRQRSRRQLSLEWFHDLGGRFEAAREAGLQHVALARAAGALGAIPALSNLADTEFVLGHSEVAIALCREAIERAAALGRPAAAVHAYGNMVPALLARGELDQAEEAIRAGRALLVRGLGTAFVLLFPLALLTQRRNLSELSARLVGCADRAYAEGASNASARAEDARECARRVAREPAGGGNSRHCSLKGRAGPKRKDSPAPASAKSRQHNPGSEDGRPSSDARRAPLCPDSGCSAGRTRA